MLWNKIFWQCYLERHLSPFGCVKIYGRTKASAEEGKVSISGTDTRWNVIEIFIKSSHQENRGVAMGSSADVFYADGVC